MKRKIISINEELCNGCGDCVPGCHEGALQIIDGKVRLISDLFCDGLGACIGFCPEGALTIEEREAEPYDERKVMDYILKGGMNVVKAHLEHLLEHNETEYYNQAVTYLEESGIENPLQFAEVKKAKAHSGCPGAKQMSFDTPKKTNEIPNTIGTEESALKQWPIQLHLINPQAGFFQNSDLLIAADCTAFAVADFHNLYRDKRLAIACPKLDTNKEVYLEKLKMLITGAQLASVTVAVMQVPCCNGLVQLVQNAMQLSGRRIPLHLVVISIQGEVIYEETFE